MIKIYDTLSRKLKPLKTKIKLFVCGITPYDYSHIGHARTFLIYDCFVKYLRYKGYEIFYLQNVTDVDDKIIARANSEGIQWSAIAKKFFQAYLEDCQALGITAIDKFAWATNYMKEIIEQIKILVDKGFAYATSDGSVFFELDRFEDAGKLSGQNREAVRSGLRIEPHPEKKAPYDFALWKARKPGEPYWHSPWGLGRPGWHIEDTAIAAKEFGPQYDMHGGAIELVFPHHECEIAQMESAYGFKPMVDIWMHTGLLTVNGEKMSKSLGNVILIRDILKEFKPEILRFYFLLTHYQSPLDYTKEKLEKAKVQWYRMQNFIENLLILQKKVKAGKSNQKIKFSIEKALSAIENQLDNDFNTPNAIAEIFKFINVLYPEILSLNRKEIEEILAFFKKINTFFNFISFEEKELPEEIKKLIEERKAARKLKDWPKADALREKIKALGYEVRDLKEETICLKII